MNVALVQLPIEDYYTTSIRTYPLGLLYLAAAIKGECTPFLLDCRTPQVRQNITAEKDHILEQLYNPHKTSPFQLFRHYQHFGLAEEDIITQLNTIQPQIICFSLMFTAYSEKQLETIRKIKSFFPEVKLIIGGIHATLFPEHCLDVADYVIRGEGEEPMLLLVRSLKRGELFPDNIPGLCYCHKGQKIIQTPFAHQHLNLLPHRELIDCHEYTMFRKPYAFLLTSRGCPHHCHFCGKMNVPYRPIDLELVAEDLDCCKNEGLKILDIEDDMLIYRKRRTRELLSLFSQFDFEYYAMNGISPNTFNHSIGREFEHAGFKKCNISLVSASREAVVGQNRKAIENLYAIFGFFSDSEMLCEMHFIIGLPGQKISDILETMVLLMEQKVLLGPSIYYPVPGSLYWLQQSAHFSDCRSSKLFPAQFTRIETATILQLCRVINFCKGLIDRLQAIISVEELLKHSSFFQNELVYEAFYRFYTTETLWSFHKNTCSWQEDPQDTKIVESFLTRIKGKSISGFSSKDKLLF